MGTALISIAIFLTAVVLYCCLAISAEQSRCEEQRDDERYLYTRKKEMPSGSETMLDRPDNVVPGQVDALASQVIKSGLEEKSRQV